MIGKKLWEGSLHFKESSHLYHYQQWLSSNHGLKFNSYHELWEWTINNIEDFWESIWNYFDVISHSQYTKVLSSRKMPAGKWFEGATLNYAEHLFRKG